MSNLADQSTKPNSKTEFFALISDIKSLLQYLKSKFLYLILIFLFGGVLGIVYGWLKPTYYLSRTTFVVEETKSSAGGLASLAGQFGLDISGSSGGGVFSSDNILLFLKSEDLIRETLFSEYDSIKKENLADSYAESMGFKKKWMKSNKVRAFSFYSFDYKNLPRVQDSLLQIITNDILANRLQVTRPDRKSSIIEVIFRSRNENLSQKFVFQLVQIVTNKYIESKIKYKVENVNMLQNKADSIAQILNSKSYGNAINQQQLVDANPGVKSALVPTEITTRDKTIASTLYAEVIKNLELARTVLSQSTPSVQVIDQSSFPLQKEKRGILSSFFGGALLFSVVGIFYFLFKQLKKRASSK